MGKGARSKTKKRLNSAKRAKYMAGTLNFLKSRIWNERIRRLS